MINLASLVIRTCLPIPICLLIACMNDYILII